MKLLPWGHGDPSPKLPWLGIAPKQEVNPFPSPILAEEAGGSCWQAWHQESGEDLINYDN